MQSLSANPIINSLIAKEAHACPILLLQLQSYTFSMLSQAQIVTDYTQTLFSTHKVLKIQCLICISSVISF